MLFEKTNTNLTTKWWLNIIKYQKVDKFLLVMLVYKIHNIPIHIIMILGLFFKK